MALGQTRSNGVMTSFVHEKLQRRVSERQAEKRARIQNLERLDEEDPDVPQQDVNVPQHVPGPPQRAGPFHPQPKFIPRKRPLPAGHNGNHLWMLAIRTMTMWK